MINNNQTRARDLKEQNLHALDLSAGGCCFADFVSGIVVLANSSPASSAVALLFDAIAATRLLGKALV